MKIEPALSSDNIDDLGTMIFGLLSELWVTRDRLATMEKLLVDQGSLHQDAVDDFVPDEEFSTKLETLRDRMVEEVIGATLLEEGMGVDALLERAKLKRPASKIPK